MMHIELVQRPPPLAPEGDMQTMHATHVDPTTGENEMADAARGRRPSDARSATGA